MNTARCLAAATQSAPNPQAYLNSGVVKPKQSVDVKKVLVIGSGGLAIGQAGEFDYSGSWLLAFTLRPLCSPKTVEVVTK